MREMNHPRENDLALLAGGEAGRMRRLLLDRHVRTCADCREKIAGYQQLRAELAGCLDPGSESAGSSILAARTRWDDTDPDFQQRSGIKFGPMRGEPNVHDVVMSNFCFSLFSITKSVVSAAPRLCAATT